MPLATSLSPVCYTHPNMPEGEQKRHIPPWAERERLTDMVWIGENLHVLWPAAQVGYAEAGRGAIVVDITVRPTGAGNPFAYYPQEMIATFGDADAIRMVAQYEPEWQFVAMLLKTEGRASTYRIGVPDQPPDSTHP